MNGSSSSLPLSSPPTTSNRSSASASAAAVGSSSSRSNGGNPDLILPFSGHPHPFAVNPQLNNNGWGAAFIAAALGGAGVNNSSNLMSSASLPSSGAAAADAIAALSALTAATAASAAAVAAASAATTNHLALSSSKVAVDKNNNSVIDTCRRCGATGCDVRIEHNSSSGSSGGKETTTTEAGGCLLHTRCCPPPEAPLAGCPVCRESLRCIRLLPMAFEEIDQARLRQQQQQQQQKDNRKRKQGKDGDDPDDCDDDDNNNLDRKRKASTLSASDSATAATTAPGTGESPDLRTGRWTAEETSYCDQLIHLFEAGQLPIPDGLKLNDFLSGMLRSKQARLTKKMKNAKLSSRQYRRTSGYITDPEEAVRFSLLEAGFLQSLRCDVERSEMRFHMQKEWRELFSTYCVNAGIKLDAGLWLSSVEEMDRRASRLKDAARMQRRKEMMGYALSQDHQNPQRGVFIDPNTHPAIGGSHGGGPVGAVPLGGVPLTIHHPQQQPSEAAPEIEASEKRRKLSRTSSSASISSMKPRPLASYSSPFIGKVIHFLQRRNMPFEHVDAWVPSLVPTSEVAVSGSGSSGPPSVPQGSSNVVTRLCFAGCATADVRLPENGAGPSQPMSVDDQFDLISFGLYSQKFSFDVGCGLPGRVYQSGIPSWEQGIANAPTNLFERASGASQWGIQTVLGLPIFSPNVGRIVVLFYSCFDRPRDDQVVARIIDELTKMMPSPQWKLVVDVGLPPEPAATPEETTESHEARLLRRELLSLIQFHTPADKSSPLAEFLPGFSSLRLLLSSDVSESERERDLLKASLGYFQSYRTAGVSDKDAVWMTARDFMVVSKHASSGSVAGFSMPASRQQASRPFIHQGSRAQPDDIVRAPGGFQQGGGISSRIPVSPAEQQARRGAAGSTSHLPHKGLGQSIDSDQLSASLSLLQSAQAQAPAQGDSGLTLASGMMDMPLGLSPALHPIVAGDMNFDAMSNLALGLSANQLAAFLQSDSFQLNDNSGSQ